MAHFTRGREFPSFWCKAAGSPSSCFKRTWCEALLWERSGHTYATSIVYCHAVQVGRAHFTRSRDERPSRAVNVGMTAGSKRPNYSFHCHKPAPIYTCLYCKLDFPPELACGSCGEATSHCLSLTSRNNRQINHKPTFLYSHNNPQHTSRPIQWSNLQDLHVKEFWGKYKAKTRGLESLFSLVDSSASKICDVISRKCHSECLLSVCTLLGCSLLLLLTC